MKRLFAFLSITLIVFFLFIYVKKPSTTKTAETKSTTIYNNCEIIQRSNMNIPPSTQTLPNKSKVSCNSDEILFVVTDKTGFENSKNSIYRFWRDNEGYKGLLVDQNGAGSGEGNGKVILLEKGGYELLNCFYYVPEDFTGSYYDPLTADEIDHIHKAVQSSLNSGCTNFALKSYLKTE